MVAVMSLADGVRRHSRGRQMAAGASRGARMARLGGAPATLHTRHVSGVLHGTLIGGSAA
jgi:hypothetical protein